LVYEFAKAAVMSTTNGVAKTTEVYSLTILEARSLNQDIGRVASF
jgi:hypothetical protein